MFLVNDILAKKPDLRNKADELFAKYGQQIQISFIIFKFKFHFKFKTFYLRINNIFKAKKNKKN